MDIPQILIDEELNIMINEFEHKLAESGLTLERYLEQIKKTKEELRDSWQSEAEKRIKIALILDKIARQEKIEVSDKEIKDEITKIVNQATDDQKNELVKNLEKEEQKKYIKNVLKNRKVIEFLKKLALD